MIICGVEEVHGENVAKVKIFHEKKFEFIIVSLDTLLQISKYGGLAYNEVESKLLVDFCIPRLSIK